MSCRFADGGNSCRRHIASFRRSGASILRCPHGRMVPNHATSIAPAREHILLGGSRALICGRYASVCSKGGQVSRQESAHLFLHLPGPAPTEPGRATARRTLATQPVGSLPQLNPEAERWLPVFGSVVATRGVPTCWRGSWVRKEERSLVSDSFATPRLEREAEGR